MSLLRVELRTLGLAATPLRTLLRSARAARASPKTRPRPLAARLPLATRLAHRRAPLGPCRGARLKGSAYATRGARARGPRERKGDSEAIIY